MKAVSQSVAWAAGNEAQVLTTTNGGTNWSPVGGGAIGNADIYVINALDANTAFVSTSPGTSTFIYRTEMPAQHGRMSTALPAASSTELK